MPNFSSRTAARYDFVFHIGPRGGEVVVRTGCDDARSVTNDPVVAEIAAAKSGGLGARRFSYRDTTGCYDSLDHDGYRLVGFYPIGTADQDEAIRRVDLRRVF